MEKSVLPWSQPACCFGGLVLCRRLGMSCDSWLRNFGQGEREVQAPQPCGPSPRGAAPPAAGAARTPVRPGAVLGDAAAGRAAPHCAGPFLSARCRRRGVCRRVCRIHRPPGQTWGPLSASPPNKRRKRLFKVFPPSRSRAFPLILLRESSWLYWVSLCPGILRNMRPSG